MHDLLTVVWSVLLVLMVAHMLRSLAAGLHVPDPEEPVERLGREIHTLATLGDLTVPQQKDIGILVLQVPGYEKLCRNHTPAEVFGALDLLFGIAGEAAERHKGEMAGFQGDQLVIHFGRILPVESPLSAAVSMGLDVLERLPAGAAIVKPGAAAWYGSVLSGPMGNGLRRSYTTVGLGLAQTMALARSAPEGTLLLPEGVAEPVGEDIELGPPKDGARWARRKATPAKLPIGREN